MRTGSNADISSMIVTSGRSIVRLISRKMVAFWLAQSTRAVFRRACNRVDLWACLCAPRILSGQCANYYRYQYKHQEPFSRGTFVFTTLRAVSSIAPFVQVQRSAPGFQRRFIVIFKLASIVSFQASIGSHPPTILAFFFLGSPRGAPANLSH